MHRYKALCGSAAEYVLSHGKKMQVIAVHSESVYMRAENGRMLLLCPSKYGVVPFGAALDDFYLLRGEREFFVGEYASVEKNELHFDGYVLSLDIKSGEVRRELSSMVPSYKTIGYCASYVLENASSRGMGPALPAFLCMSSPSDKSNAYALSAAAEADKLEQSLTFLDERGLSEVLGKFIGLGYGLTPSGDDFVCGMAYAFRRYSKCSEHSKKCFELLSRAVKVKLSGTNEISREYLLCATGGEYFEVVERVLDAISKKAIVRAEADIAMAKLLTVGASSGSDILCGILFACYLLS